MNCRQGSGQHQGILQKNLGFFFSLFAQSGPIRLDDIFDGPAADGAAGVDLSLELQPTLVAQTHVSAGVDDRVHLLVEAHRALPALPRQRQLWSGEGRRHGGTQRGAGGRDQRRLGGRGGPVDAEGQV